MSAAALLTALGSELRPFGLNLIGAAPIAAYDALVPESHRLFGRGTTARAAIVIGHGGGAFWSAYRDHLTRHPEWEQRADPLDDFTAEIMARRALALAARLGVPAELRLPFRSSDPPLSFVHLAEAAGLGRRGLVGVLIHPEFGPWIALRGALLVGEEITAPRPAAGFDPCPSCADRPCIAACPGAAVGHPGGWDIPRCIAHRLAQPADCTDRCHARVACVYGRYHRYADGELAYHQRRAFTVMAGAAAARDMRNVGKRLLVGQAEAGLSSERYR